MIANASVSSASATDVVHVAIEADGVAWDRFLAGHTSVSGGATFYHLFEWQQINSQVLKHQSIYLSARRSGQIVGVLPLVFIGSKLFGRILCSVPFVNYGGPVGVDEAANRALIAAAVAKAEELHADYLELRAARELPTELTASLRKISMTLALDADPENLWKNFSSKHRNNVRRIQKQGLRVQSGGGELLEVFYAVMEASWGILGTPMYSREYFKRIVDVFGDAVRIFVCYKDDVAIAVAFNGHFGETVEGMWAGGQPEFRDAQANYVLYWEMMRDACVRGFKRYHLGRSSADSGGEQFKKKWNAEITQLYWYFHRPDGGAMPELNVDNPKYKLAIAVWRRLPTAVTRLIGPPLARLIP